MDSCLYQRGKNNKKLVLTLYDDGDEGLVILNEVHELDVFFRRIKKII